jgi:hypothetical protein
MEWGLLGLFIVFLIIVAIIASIFNADYETVLFIVVGCILFIALIVWLVRLWADKKSSSYQPPKDSHPNTSESTTTKEVLSKPAPTIKAPQSKKTYSVRAKTKHPPVVYSDPVAFEPLKASKPKESVSEVSSKTKESVSSAPVARVSPPSSPVRKPPKPEFHPLVTEITLRNSVPDITFHKAWDYYRWGWVTEVHRDENFISGTVRGHNGNVYSPWVRIKDGNIDSDYCDCMAYENYPGPCKHIIALVLTANAKGFQEVIPVAAPKEMPSKQESISPITIPEEPKKVSKPRKSKVPSKTRAVKVVCPECGNVFASTDKCCPECGFPTSMARRK